MIHAPTAVWGVLLALWSLSFLYTAVALGRLLTLRLPQPARGADLPKVSVVKPLCGLEPELEENLATFCEQEYSPYHVIFSVRDGTDPAVAAARRVIAAHPSCDASVVVGGGRPSRNPKIENLSAAVSQALGEIIVIADSDMRVDPAYLREVAAPFADDRVGAVTALFGARAAGTTVSRLGAMFVNDQFVPSVLVATLLQPIGYTFGATMAVRRAVLDEIGGITAIGGTIADDYMLGRLVTERGYRVAFAGSIPLTLVSEPKLSDLVAREVRWARTVRSVRPLGYVGTILTFPILFGLLNLLFLPSAAAGAALLLASLVERIALHVGANAALRIPGAARPWLVPLREALSVAVWAGGLFGSRARWRHHDLRVSN